MNVERVEKVGGDGVEVLFDGTGKRKLDKATEALTPARQESQATVLVKLALAETKPFHAGENCYVDIVVNGHRETHSLKSRAFKRWLSHVFFEKTKKSPNRESIQAAIATLSGFAQFKCAEQKVSVRVGAEHGRIYLDLCDDAWNVIEVDASGWRVIASDECPVRFRRSHGMRALPVPEADSSTDELRRFVNLGSEDDFVLVVAWLVSCLREHGPYPVLVLHAEQGSGKTTLERILRDLVDPNLAAVRSEPREARDLMIAASNGWVVAFDNLSRIMPWLSDALCRLSTGGGFSTRELYTDDDEIIFEAERPVIISSIEEIATRGDLLDRAIIVQLPRIEDEKRQTESELEAAFAEARPRILGALLDAVSCALRNLDSTRPAHLPRMADFAQWVMAAEPDLGWTPGTFADAYSANRASANELALEASLVAGLIRRIDMPFTGNAGDLLSSLNAVAEEQEKRLPSYPRTPKALSGQLRRIAPNLREAGIDIDFSRQGHKRQRTIALSCNVGKLSSASSAPSALFEEKDLTADAKADADDPAIVRTELPSAAIPVQGKDLVPADGADAKIPPLRSGSEIKATEGEL